MTRTTQNAPASQAKRGASTGRHVIAKKTNQSPPPGGKTTKAPKFVLRPVATTGTLRSNPRTVAKREDAPKYVRRARCMMRARECGIPMISPQAATESQVTIYGMGVALGMTICRSGLVRKLKEKNKPRGSTNLIVSLADYSTSVDAMYKHIWAPLQDKLAEMSM